MKTILSKLKYLFLPKCKVYDSVSFMRGSFAIFKECRIPSGKPDFVSKSGSKYWYTKKGVIRESDHWYDVAGCQWEREGREFSCGFCRFDNFYPMREYKTHHFDHDVDFDFGDEDFPVVPENRKLKNNIAVEFGSIQLCTLEDIHYPLDDHPNHRSRFVNLVDGLFFEDIKNIILC